jgi:FkbM family methyltransferase
MELISIGKVAKVVAKQILGKEPWVHRQKKVNLEFHGDKDYGWKIPTNVLDSSSLVVDVGLGENISFSVSVQKKYGFVVHGFDPTPRAIEYVTNLKPPGFFFYEFGLGALTEKAQFFLPNNESHVSGSIVHEHHVGGRTVEVQLKSLRDLFLTAGINHIDLLKIDIEGAEYDVISSDDFNLLACKIKILCLEFHHRWPLLGQDATRKAISTLNKLGFHCVWRSFETNEEFTFLRT